MLFEHWGPNRSGMLQIVDIDGWKPWVDSRAIVLGQNREVAELFDLFDSFLSRRLGKWSPPHHGGGQPAALTRDALTVAREKLSEMFRVMESEKMSSKSMTNVPFLLDARQTPKRGETKSE